MLELSVTPKAESDLIGVWVYTCEKEVLIGRINFLGGFKVLPLARILALR